MNDWQYLALRALSHDRIMDMDSLKYSAQDKESAGIDIE